MCYPCNTSCSQCFGPSIEECTQCVSPYLLNSTTCLTVCPDGFYANTTSGTCLPCDAACATCVDNTNNCTVCASSAFIYINQCFALCPGILVADVPQKACRARCPPGRNKLFFSLPYLMYSVSN